MGGEIWGVHGLMVREEFKAKYGEVV